MSVAETTPDIVPRGGDAHESVDVGFSPHGHVRLVPAEGGVFGLTPARARELREALARGEGAFIVRLGVGASGGEGERLGPGLEFVRGLGRAFVTALCTAPGLELATGAVEVKAPAGLLSSMARGVPPLTGAEYVNEDVLTRLWAEASAAFGREVEASGLSARALLERDHPTWNLVGRVYFHLAENKNDPASPFAFLSTFAASVSARGVAQHRPLARALELAAGEPRALLTLLAPVQKAAALSPFVRSLVDSGALYHPQAFSADHAYAFLRSVPVLESSGVVVRVPDWWNARTPPRPQVSVRVGSSAPSTVGKDALLDFRAEVTVGGEPLTEDEWRALAGRERGLVRVKGQWVELDRPKLDEALAHFRVARRAVEREGITFFGAMRLLAGLPAEAGGVDDALAPLSTGWCEVTPGPWLARTLDALRTESTGDGFGPEAGLRATLRPYQAAGAAWLYALYRLGLGACLADDMGLGKTVQVIALLARLGREEGRGPDLLVVPTSLLANWQSEIARFAPALRVHTAHASGDGIEVPPPDAAVVLTTYGSLRRLEWARTTTFRVVVLDEAQAIKNPGARQTRAVKALHSRSRVALTGTPVENRLGDLWSLFDFINPGLLGSARAFGGATKRLAERGPGGYGPLRAVVRPYLLRRLKTDRSVIADLPDKTERVVHCGLTPRQAALYEEAVENLDEALRDAEGLARKGAILAAITRFKQICNHPSHWLGDGAFDARASGKFLALASLGEEIAARQEKALVFTQFREMTEPLAAFLARVFGRPGVMLSGATAVKKRAALVADFARDEGPPFFVLSLKAGGTGLNLTAASHVIHFDRWWNPAVEAQATDRAYRIGQHRNVLVHKFVCRGTVEEKVDALLTAKKSLATAILDGEVTPTLTELTNAEVMRLVALDLRAALAGDDDDTG